MKRSALIVVLASLLIPAAGAAQGGWGSSERDRDTLKRLPGVGVAVEEIDHTAGTAIGLTAASIKTAAELRLRQYGIKVLSPEEVLATKEWPYLYVNVNLVRKAVDVDTAFSIDLTVNQFATLVSTSELAYVSTWATGGAGSVGDSADPAQYIRTRVIDKVDAFINDFLAANPQVKVPSP